MEFKRAKKNIIQSISKLLISQLLELLEEEIDNKKKLWVRKWIARRNSFGGSALLLKELYLEDPIEYTSCLRMSPESFDILLNLVGPEIQKVDTFMRDAIPARVKLEITLSYLNTGNSYRSLQHFFRVSKATISLLIPEVCDVIYNKLEEYIKMPSSEEEWKKLETGFFDKWNFPKCYGAIDGKHVGIRAPSHCGSAYYNYKKSNSIILMALVDHDYCFKYIDVGANGSVSDGAVFRNCSLLQALENNLLPPGGVILGDDGFALKSYLMKPYPHKNLTYDDKIFNYRLSRARRTVENAFGLLVSRFRIFEKPIACNVNTSVKIICTTCALHNWLRFNSTQTYLPSGSVDVEDINSGTIVPGTWRLETTGITSVGHFGTNHSSRQAKSIRDKFKAYFINEGKVSWQDRMIH